MKQLEIKIAALGFQKSLFRIDVYPQLWLDGDWELYIEQISLPPEQLKQILLETSFACINGYHRLRYAKEHNIGTIPINIKVPFDQRTQKKLDLEQISKSKQLANKARGFKDSK